MRDIIPYLRCFQVDVLSHFGIRSVTMVSSDQKSYLTSIFESNPHPSKEVCSEIAAELGFTLQKVEKWFRYQRSKLSKK